MNQTYELSANDRADKSVRIVLRVLFSTLQSKIGGVLEGIDDEYLHDFRVATRRTRTALSQIKSVLPLYSIEEFSPEFKWLGTVTGPLRDLDVHLLGIDAYRRVSGVDGDALDTLRQSLDEARLSEHSRVSTALRSIRFQKLIDDWERFLDSEGEGFAEPPLASAPIIEVAGPRIHKAFKRIRKRGASATEAVPASLLHRIRIDGKKLRYLLEFFADLYPQDAISRFIKELKRLQNILGEFNDTEVQLTHIAAFNGAGGQASEALAATSRLCEIIVERQRELRTEFVDRFAIFASDDNRRLYKKTFKAR